MSLVGRLVEFDIKRDDPYSTFNVGFIKSVSGDDIEIQQTEEVYKGKTKFTNRIRIRNLPFDLANGYIRI